MKETMTSADSTAVADTSAATSAPPTATMVASHLESLAERRQRGKALRNTVPRSAHAHWSPPTDRANPISVLQISDPLRQPDLLPIRYGRMLESPFTFLRGSAAVMACDLASTPTTDLLAQ